MPRMYSGAVFRHEPAMAGAWWARRHDGLNRVCAMPAASPARTSLLVVDDEPDMRGLLAEYFGRHGFAVREAGSGAEAREAIARSRPDLAVLDVTMPGENGLSLLRWLRDAHPGVAVVMLTGNGETIDRVVGLELGADDYVAKPCELRELLARVRAVLRRSSGAAATAGSQAAATAAPAATTAVAPALAPAATRASTPAAAPPPQRAALTVVMGDRVLDLDRRQLRGPDGTVIDTSAAEFELLALFARNPNRPLKRDQILEQAHDRGWDVFDRSIDLRIMRLRRKLERNPDTPQVIRTVRGVGYVFVPDSPGTDA
jgi:two-component system phosphate regulon response regulator OmpR